MYVLILDKDRMGKLYFVRERRKKKGKKATIVGMVREAVDKYLKEEKNVERN